MDKYLGRDVNGYKARVPVFAGALGIFKVFVLLSRRDPVHGVADWREEEVVHLHLRQQLVDARLLKQIRKVGAEAPAYSQGHPWRTSDQRSSSCSDPDRSSSAPASGQERSF